jgi:hypothetical protein
MSKWLTPGVVNTLKMLATPVYETAWQAELDRTRRCSTKRLKQLWDQYDGTTTGVPDISGEAVHRILNERGEGDYCAV